MKSTAVVGILWAIIIKSKTNPKPNKHDIEKKNNNQKKSPQDGKLEDRYHIANEDPARWL